MSFKFSASKSGFKVNYVVSGYEADNFVRGQVLRKSYNPDGTKTIVSFEFVGVNNLPEELQLWLENLNLIKLQKENLEASWTLKVKRIIGVPNAYTYSLIPINDNNNVNSKNRIIIDKRNYVSRSVSIAPKVFYDYNASTSPYVEAFTKTTTTINETIERGAYYKVSATIYNEECPSGSYTIEQGTYEIETVDRKTLVEKYYRPRYLFVNTIDDALTICEKEKDVILSCDYGSAKGTLKLIIGQGCSTFGIAYYEFGYYDPLGKKPTKTNPPLGVRKD